MPLRFPFGRPRELEVVFPFQHELPVDHISHCRAWLDLHFFGVHGVYIGRSSRLFCTSYMTAFLENISDVERGMSERWLDGLLRYADSLAWLGDTNHRLNEQSE